MLSRCPARILAVPVLLTMAASWPAAAIAARPASRSAAFVCDSGVRFSVIYQGGRARITTSHGSWVLGRRPSSIGRKFQSGEATFIHDHELAALNGLPGGPFRRCREAGQLLTGARP